MNRVFFEKRAKKSKCAVIVSLPPQGKWNFMDIVAAFQQFGGFTAYGDIEDGFYYFELSSEEAANMACMKGTIEIENYTLKVSRI
jgi:hypothetical protein